MHTDVYNAWITALTLWKFSTIVLQVEHKSSASFAPPDPSNETLIKHRSTKTLIILNQHYQTPNVIIQNYCWRMQIKQTKRPLIDQIAVSVLFWSKTLLMEYNSVYVDGYAKLKTHAGFQPSGTSALFPRIQLWLHLIGYLSDQSNQEPMKRGHARALYLNFIIADSSRRVDNITQ